MTGPARLARRLLDITLPLQHRDVVLTHLDEEYAHVLRTQSPRAAKRWYWRQVTGSLSGAVQMRLQSPEGSGRSGRTVARVSRLFSEFLHDARYGLRQLRKAPGFSIAAVAMLAVGLGLVAGAYTVVNGMFIRGWDIPDNKGVFRAWAGVAGAPEGGRIDDGFSYGAYRHIREHGKTADYIAFTYENKRLGTSKETALYSSGFFVSDNFIEALKIPLQQGTGFTGTRADDGARVILTDKLWRAAFNQDPGMIGRSIWVSGMPATVVGITAPGFQNLGERTLDFMTEITASPLWAMRGRPDVVADDRSCCVSLAGRVRPGSSLALVGEELRLLTAQYRQATVQPELTVAMRDTSPQIPTDRGVALVFALAGAGVVLVWVLTCANVGNLFLARSLKRDREIAVRLALGASRGRLVRQLLAEGLVLAGLAGSLALALAAGVPTVFERLDDASAAMFAPDFIVVGVAGLATVVTCLLVALAPALYATRINWKGAGRTATVRPGRLREVVLAVQIAVATVLVLSATLIGRGILQASTALADFALHSTTAAEFQLPSNATDGQRKTTRTALHAAIKNAGDEFAMAEMVPASARSGLQTSVRRVDDRVEYRALLLQMTSTAFQVLEVPFVEGRPASDVPGRDEAVINQTLARRLWPEGNAIGKSLHLDFYNAKYTIVGVTADTHLAGLGEIGPLIHTSQLSNAGVALARTTPGLRDRLTALARTVDPTLTVKLTPLSESVQSSIKGALGGAIVASGLAVIALFLAVIGVFGVFSYLIEERRCEIGIRLALGATRSQVRTALAHACRLPVMTGVAVGLGLSMLAGGLLRGFLFGLSPLDPISYAVVAVILTVSATVATAVPVRRALRVDPAITLRAE